MVYLVSDLHGGKDMASFVEYTRTAKPDDLLIVLGDTELQFIDTEENRRFTEYFLSLKLQIAIVDGNHENHAFLRSFPEEEAFGAPVHRLSESIVYLKRGYIYTIEGMRFFVMGGCKSSPKWYAMGLAYEHEEPSETEISLAYQTLHAHGNQVDYILTHLYERAVPEDAPPCSLTGLNRYLDKSVDYRHWYSGHWHRQETIDARHTIVFDRVIALA